MYLVDFHTHSLCSPDSDAPLADMVRAAADAGLSQLCTTDHFDLLADFGGPAEDPDWGAITGQYEQVLRALPRGVTLRLGLELGSGHLDLDRARRVLSQAPLDFVLGSVHNQSPEAGGTDFYFLKYDSPAFCYDALDNYFASMAELAPLDCYDSLAHVIYPLRYMCRRDGQNVTLDRYWDRMGDIFQKAAETGHALELNTERGKTIADWKPVLELFRARGGELVTLGSDAHSPKDVGSGIAQAQALLRACGWKYFTVYQNRKPQQIKL